MRQPSMHGERGGTWSAINQPSISHQCTGSAVARVGACGHGGCSGEEDMGQSAAMGASHARKPTLGSRGASGRRHANNRRTTPLPLATQQHIGTSLILKHNRLGPTRAKQPKNSGRVHALAIHIDPRIVH